MLLDDAPFGIQNEGGRQSGNAAVCRANGFGSHGDGIVDAGFVDVLLNIGSVIVVDIEADNLEAAFVLRLQGDEIGDFGAARSAPGSPEIQKDNLAAKCFEGEWLAVERGEFKVRCGIGIAHKTNYRRVVLLREDGARREQEK